jgi:ribosome-binding protein aMBF1 (putative translation factor)
MSQLTELKSERDDLAHVLAISLQANANLKRTLTNEQHSNGAHWDSATSSYGHEISKAKRQATIQIEELAHKLEETQHPLEEERVQTKISDKNL